MEKKKTFDCPSSESKRVSEPELRLEDLVKDYLTKKRWNGFFQENLTHQEVHKKYLSHLNDLTDYICGEVNKEKIPKGKKYILSGHQKRPLNGKWELINAKGEKLKNLEKEEFENFEQLIDFVEKAHVPYFGDTANYDIALRFGWNRKPRIEPEKFVYVHSKPLISAIKLKELGYLKEVNRKIPFEDFPKEIRQKGMTASDIENFLCIYRQQIEKLNN